MDPIHLHVLQADLVPESDLNRLKALLRCLNTEAEIVVTKESRVDPCAVLGTRRFSLEKAARAAGWLKVLRPYDSMSLVLLRRSFDISHAK